MKETNMKFALLNVLILFSMCFKITQTMQIKPETNICLNNALNKFFGNEKTYF